MKTKILVPTALITLLSASISFAEDRVRIDCNSSSHYPEIRIHGVYPQPIQGSPSKGLLKLQEGTTTRIYPSSIFIGAWNLYETMIYIGQAGTLYSQNFPSASSGNFDATLSVFSNPNLNAELHCNIIGALHETHPR